MISLHEINYSYPKQPKLFDQLNLTLAAGNIYGLLGKNGAGKSTLLKLITGVIFPTNGQLNVFGYPSSERAKLMLQEVFLLTEDHSNHNLTGLDYLQIYAEFYPKFEHSKFTSIAHEWQLNLAHKLSELSEGERKKFFIAFGLSTNCRLILLDEPTNGLDIPAKAIFRKLIAKVAREDNIIVISSHQVRDLEGLIDPIIIIDNGKVLLNQSLAAVAEKISFARGSKIPEHQFTLYAMRSIAGYVYSQIKQGEVNDYSAEIDLELLFNTVIENPQVISKLFGEQQ